MVVWQQTSSSLRPRGAMSMAIDLQFALLTREHSKNVAATLALEDPMNTIARHTADRVGVYLFSFVLL